MQGTQSIKIAIVYPGDESIRRTATAENNRFAPLFSALTELGVQAEPTVYHPDFWEEVYHQLLQVDGVLVWVNPIQDGHDRTVLDAMLRKVAEAGVFVSTHPDIILKMGTKEVLYQTRHMSWGCDTHLYHNADQLQQELPTRLAGGARVLKQNRGHSGLGVWKIEATAPSEATSTSAALMPTALVRVRQAERGSIDQIITLEEFLGRYEAYFAGSGKMIDQVYQARLPEGMIRCYLVHDQVAGFGHQAINALYPTPPGASPGEVPQPGPRLYYSPDRADFQVLKSKLEQEWVQELQALLGIPTERLPVLWDADFLLGPTDEAGNDTYVLCEINVSSVAPYPDSATSVVARAALIRAQSARLQR
jgi:hypothetical protein